MKVNLFIIYKSHFVMNNAYKKFLMDKQTTQPTI